MSAVENYLRRIWRYQRGNQNPYIEEEQTTQWPKEKVQKAKQRSTKHTHKTKDRVTRTTIKTGGELGCSGRVSSSCFASGTRRVNLVTNPVISHEFGIHNCQLFIETGNNLRQVVADIERLIWWKKLPFWIRVLWQYFECLHTQYSRGLMGVLSESPEVSRMSKLMKV